ncbi:SRPBCC family protein [Sinomicrobium pectinilyticum]|uniref:SRPBCC family protein n=1 Tax=Sinomicrobium pectinilyticum TaxID=1084421 RepID=A0A3N0F5K1_SINP1|nr:SRPBCC family protein [Sinomicrobium pectinilyticum]RNL95279.1 SRPBCC family protein [Sinomicrobium pectinilyticum]
MTLPSRHISISIDKPMKAVYDFVSDPLNLPKWAAGLSGSIRKEGDVWIAESPMGSVQVAFVPSNDLGVLDHEVTLPSGETVYNPMRVFSNADGCEIVFSLYQLPGMTEKQYQQDARLVEMDLLQLKEIVENIPG